MARAQKKMEAENEIIKKIQPEIDEQGRFLNKREMIKEEEARLIDIFKDIEEKRRKVTASLIPRAANLTIQAQELECILTVKGYTEEYWNGANQHGIKKTCEAEIYNNTVKNHMNVIKQLTDQLPKQDAKAAGVADDFDDFLSARSK